MGDGVLVTPALFHLPSRSTHFLTASSKQGRFSLTFPPPNPMMCDTAVTLCDPSLRRLWPPVSLENGRQHHHEQQQQQQPRHARTRIDFLRWPSPLGSDLLFGPLCRSWYTADHTEIPSVSPSRQSPPPAKKAIRPITSPPSSSSCDKETWAQKAAHKPKPGGRTTTTAKRGATRSRAVTVASGLAWRQKSPHQQPATRYIYHQRRYRRRYQRRHSRPPPAAAQKV